MGESKSRYTVEEVARIIGVENGVIVDYVRREWLSPEEPESPGLDEEDLARARLISELTGEMGVNDEAVPIILHLVDQIHYLQLQFKRRFTEKPELN